MDPRGILPCMKETITIAGQHVRRLGFGAMRVTGEGVWGEPPNPPAAKDVLRRVVDAGVQFIDTADSYGPDVSERLIGESLAPYPKDVLVATKAGLVRPAPGDWKPNGRPDHIKQACDGSLMRLRMERIPLYQLHRIDPDVPVEDTIGAMLELREAGKIDQIGLSEVSVEELRRVQQMTPVASVQNRFSIGDREWAPVLQVCEAEDIAFIPWYPLAAGDLGALAGPLDEMAATYDTSRYVVALAWLLRHSPVIVPIPGTSSIAHFEENRTALALAPQLRDDDVQRLNDLA